jgi:hypothetical protein
MKNLMKIFLLILTMTSCRTEEEQPEFEMAGIWSLIAVEYAWVGTVVEDEIGFFESYIFERNGTFVKNSTRITNDQNVEIPLQAAGTYSVTPSGDTRFLFEVELVFTSGKQLVANCGDEDRESLQVLPDKRLSNKGWAACDGPGFYFKREVD